jgi:hypothetical protein
MDIEQKRLRPDWWDAWLDYPHGPMSEEQARELNRYAIYLEDRVLSLQAELTAMLVLMDCREGRA